MLKPFIGAVIASCFITQATAQQNRQCDDRDRIVEGLASIYGESRQMIGLVKNGVLEVYGSLETGTWTITVTDPDGTMCLIASGQNFELTNEQLHPTALGELL